MEAYFNSRDLSFRSPFGAVTEGQELFLKIDIWDCYLESAALRLWTETGGEKAGGEETRIPMQISERSGGYTASVNYTPYGTGLIWYRFELTDSEGRIFYYGVSAGKKGGAGTIYTDEFKCPSYQITVFHERKAPDWYKNGIVYQIFPDRFAREEGVSDKELRRHLIGHENGTPRKIVPWDREPGYDRNRDGSIKYWDFYGGSLRGIMQKLPYLKDLGITILYLTPIFEAASNHRYDTGDYNSVDPLLGTEEDFSKLCREAEKYGISIILDGVFNHTGCDSIYFNKYGNYFSEGAYQSENSPYRSWFAFNPEIPDGYESWWGVSDLPNVREEDPDYQTFIYGGKDSIVRKWMRLGAKGWRLDVADELPDYFIAGIKKAMLEESPDNALLMGEVWEDASNKEAYGLRRRYFQGEELDCVMNYPFREGVCNFLTGNCTAEEFCETLYSLLENYPKEAFYSCLNLIGSHDRMRIFSILGEAPDPEKMTDAEKKSYHLSDSAKGLAKGRLWLAALLQMTMPGVPCIYYGDEAGMEGYTDPYNRGAFPWGHEDKDCRTIYDNAIGIRRSHKIFTEGDFIPFASGKDVIGYTRKLGNEAVTVLINRSRTEKAKVSIPKLGPFAADLIGGKNYSSAEETVEVELGGLGSAIIYFSPEQRLGVRFESGTGVLCHVTSIPNDGKPGVLGPKVFSFLDLLKKHGEKYWQILPLNPTDPQGSPYAGSSAFAGNLDLLPYSDAEIKEQYEVYRMIAGKIRPAVEYPENGDEYETFLKDNEDWVDGYAMYSAIKDRNKGASWKEWDKKFASYTGILWKDAKLAAAADQYRYRQFMFEKCWQAVRSYADSLGIKIIGDMPIYVSADSADVWQYPELFTIGSSSSDPEGEALVAGVPPDYFSADGQLWGNPLYRWDRMKKDGYSWWMKRFARAFRLYDIVRLDHFRGFEAYWAVPEGEKAIKGSWKHGPGRELFEKAFEVFGPLPVIAEDLGYITPGVRSLIITTGFPGMDVMEFADKDPKKSYEPAADRVAYTGTHDNETLLGWVRNRYRAEAEAAVSKKAEAKKAEADKAEIKAAKAVAEKEKAEAAKAKAEKTGEKSTDNQEAQTEKELKAIYLEMLERFYRCGAFIRIVPLQDLLGLDNSARMNTPGTVGSNWKWQAEEPLDWNIGGK